MIGFIGLGNMATAIIGGILKKELVLSNEIIGSAKTQETMEKCREKYGIEVADNATVAARADILFLAVKPVFFPEVIAQIKDVVRENTVIVSIAAGKTLAYIEELFGKKCKLVRCMPNTPALVLEGCTAVTYGELVTAEEKERVGKVLTSFGTVSEVPERLMDVVVGVSGSSPAYVFMFIEAMADEAVCGTVGAWKCEAYAGNRQTSRRIERYGMLPRRNNHRGGQGFGGNGHARCSDGCHGVLHRKVKEPLLHRKKVSA